MKKLLASIALVAAITPAFAQVDLGTNATQIIAFAQGVSGNSNLTFSVYPSYAPDLINSKGESDQWGAGVALTYSFNGDVGQYLFTGLRLDWLGSELWAPSINGGLKADVQLFGHNFTPFVYTGTVVPLGGAGSLNGEFSMIVGGGVTTRIWSGRVFGKDASLGITAAAEHWGNFEGNVYHLAPSFTVHF